MTNTINDIVNKLYEIQHELDEAKQRAIFTSRMAVYGGWILYFVKNVLAHEMKQRGVHSIRSKKVTVPLLMYAYHAWRDVAAAVDSILRGYKLEMHHVTMAMSFVREFCPDASDTHVDLRNAPVVRFIDNRYDESIILIIQAVQKAIN